LNKINRRGSSKLDSGAHSIWKTGVSFFFFFFSSRIALIEHNLNWKCNSIRKSQVRLYVCMYVMFVCMRRGKMETTTPTTRVIATTGSHGLFWLIVSRFGKLFSEPALTSLAHKNILIRPINNHA
jgi:hypothetical protein